MAQHRILFATDFTDRDVPVFNRACELALRMQAKLYILHVQDPRHEAHSKATRKDPDKEFLKYIPENYGLNFDQVLKVGEAANTILEFVEQEDIDLIVLGTHGRKGLDRVFSGSVAETVLKIANCPVMTIRDSLQTHEQVDKPRILVPIDFSAFGYAALDYASKIAVALHADITIVHVDEEDNTATPDTPHGSSEFTERQKLLWEQLRKFTPSTDKVEFAHKLFKGDAGKEIVDYANSKHYDLIVIGTHGRTGLGRVLMGSVAVNVVRTADCPVITVKPSNKRTGVLAAD